MRKDSSGTLQYIPGLKNISFHVNKRWIRCIFPYFNGTLLETATSKHNLYHGFFIFMCGIIITLTKSSVINNSSVLDRLVCFFTKKTLLYRAITKWIQDDTLL